MNKDKIRQYISTVFFSVGILMLLILSNNNIFAYGQIQNEKDMDDKKDTNYK
jgi:hypothetical protein